MLDVIGRLLGQQPAQPSVQHAPHQAAGHRGQGRRPPPPSIPPSFDAAYLKTRNDFLIFSLFEDQALQCNQCGVRYPSDAEALLAQHYDWHFVVNKVRLRSLKSGFA